MKKTFLYSMLAIVITMMAGCTKLDNPTTSAPSRIEGTWYATQYFSCEVMDMYSPFEEFYTSYDRVVAQITLYGDGFGYWAYYFLNGQQLVGFSGYYYADFEYTIDATGHITLTHGKYADEEDKWPGLPVLRYEDGKIVSSGGEHSVVLMPADEAMMEQIWAWQQTIDELHTAGEEDTEVPTGVMDDPATEPSLIRKRAEKE